MAGAETVVPAGAAAWLEAWAVALLPQPVGVEVKAGRQAMSGNGRKAAAEVAHLPGQRRGLLPD